jgi:hypothetical protein
MTQEQKDLLLKDLSSRLPYGVKVKYENEIFDVEYVCPMYEEVKLDIPETWTVGVSEVKPYLFPMSSMNEEQRNEYNRLRGSSPIPSYYCDDLGEIVEEGDLRETVASIDYLYKNHFDIHGLIPIGLAIDCTNLNIY